MDGFGKVRKKKVGRRTKSWQLKWNEDKMLSWKWLEWKVMGTNKGSFYMSTFWWSRHDCFQQGNVGLGPEQELLLNISCFAWREENFLHVTSMIDVGFIRPFPHIIPSSWYLSGWTLPPVNMMKVSLGVCTPKTVS